MKAIPVDQSRCTLLVVGPPRPQTKRETGEVMTDQATGVPLVNVDVVATVGDRAELVSLGLPRTGVPEEGFPPGTVVVADELVAIVWQKAERGGVMMKAASLRALTAPTSSSRNGSATVAAR